MLILTHIAEDASNAAKIHGRLNELQASLKNIYESQSIDLLIRLTDKRFFKKGIGGYRVLFSRHLHGEYTLICAFKFLSHNDEYDETLNHLRNQREADRLYDDIEIKHNQLFTGLIAEFERQSEPPKLPEPSQQETIWLTCGGDPVQQIMVLETEQWMKAQSDNRFMRSANAIHSKLQNQVYNKVDSIQRNNFAVPNNLTATRLWPTGYLDGADFRIHLQYFPDHHTLLLLDLTELSTDQPNQPLSPNTDRQTLLKMARRAYPMDVFLLNAEDFAKIQSQQEGNLALSPEESDILSQVNGLKQNRFPLFINGRAGSGKSTILHYLLKDYLYLSVEHWRRDVGHTPLYLTYSRKLLEVAKKHVERLLTANAGILINQQSGWEHSLKQNKKLIFEKTFKLFHEFLVELLPVELRSKFAPENRVGYIEFKRQWAKTAARERQLSKGNSADLVWHVLRTYIKGMSTETNNYFNPDAYQKLPRKYKTVSDEHFIEIYEWWNSAYSSYCESNQLWDDQDLALTVLEEANFPTTYPAIFCDEAQDFTAVELKIIYRLSLFASREIPHYNVGHIPFVFAGDPLQTLNPTGFRWEAVKSSFHDYLLGPIERRVNTKCEFNYQELLANYRSIKKIVNFCNYIQLVRLCLFDDSFRIKPQISWFADSSGIAPFICSLSTTEAENLLRCNTLVIIPNCHEDELQEYVSKDDLLKRTVKSDETGVPSTVLSPNMAKGLEYDEIVVLYRFGSTCPPSLIERLQGRGSKDPGSAVTIEWEYFLNRLYVAASRAKRRLVILDEPEAIRSFWSIMQGKDAQQLVATLTADVDYQEWGGDRILMLRDGLPGDIKRILTDSKLTVDAAELADKWYQEGLDASNSGLLRRACSLYEDLESRQNKAKECKAHALRLELSYLDAANIYLQIDDQINGLNCLWAVSKFDRIADFNWQESLRGDLRITLASKLHRSGKNSTWDWIGNCADIVRILPQIKPTVFSNTKEAADGWLNSIRALLNWVMKLPDVDVPQLLPQWGRLNDLAKRFCTLEEQAIIAYKLHQYAEAIRLWKEAGKTTDKRYYWCEYKTSDWPQTLNPLDKLGEYGTIVRDWQARAETIDNLEESQAVILIKALIETGGLVRAVNLLSRHLLIKKPKALRSLTEKLWRQLDRLPAAEATEAILLHLQALIETLAWTDLAKIFNTVDKLVAESTLTANHRSQIDNELVEILSYSEALNGASGESLDVLSQLLRSRFYNENDRWLQVIERGIKVQFVEAAIERANRIGDAIDFCYWILQLPKLRPDEYRYFEGRLSACLQKRLEWRQHQLPTDRTADRTTDRPIDRDESRIRDINQKLNITAPPELNPSSYPPPNSGILSRHLIEIVLEKRRPPTPPELASKQRLDSCDINKDKSSWLAAMKDYVKALAENDRWHELAENWCKQDSIARRYQGIDTTIEEALDLVVCTIIEPLSRSEAIVNSSTDTQQKLLDLVHRLHDEGQDKTWGRCDKLRIYHDVAGAAIERLGLHKDGVSFYKWALDNATSLGACLDMAKRLIVACERYASFLHKDNSPDWSASAQKRHAQELHKQYKLLNTEIPTYPILP